MTAVIDEAHSGARLDKALAGLVPSLSRERLKALILEGHVTGKRGVAVRDPSAKVASGQTFTIALPEPVDAEAAAQDIPLAVVLRGRAPDRGRQARRACGAPGGRQSRRHLGQCPAAPLRGAAVRHRRRRSAPASSTASTRTPRGCWSSPRSDAAHEGLARQFADHDIERALPRDRARPSPMPPSGTIDTWIGRGSDRDRKKMAVVREGRGKHAVTHYRTL
jgi:23S rRNA pseudouridine1911/1915/1917 synthase